MPVIIWFLWAYPRGPVAEIMGTRWSISRRLWGVRRWSPPDIIGVDPSTLAKWEQGKREPAGGFLGRVERFLRDETPARARRAG